MNSGHESADGRRPADLSRRFFLRGLGASIALPAFASLGAPRLFASEGAEALATTATGAPLRSAFVYFPNGAIPSSWWPSGEGADFQFKKTLQPLEPLKGLVQVCGGLNHKTAEGGPDGAGDHARGNGTFLTGVRLKKSATDIRAGVSIDQMIARRVGHLTRFPSLELACDSGRRAGACDSGYSCAYQFNLSWSSPTTPMPPESNPRLAFERLFGAGKPGERKANLERRRHEQRSILDFALDDARSMQRRLGSEDSRKLDQYLGGVRDIETRIEKTERFGDARDPQRDTPEGVPPEFADYVQLMFDMLILAFQTDSTRVATLLLAHDGSNRSFDQIGISEGHHDLSHHQNRPDWVQKVADIDLWYVRQFGKFLDKLQATNDVDGKSLLHNSMIVYGSGNADANRHTHDNLPVVLAGAGGGVLTPGRYVKHGSKPLSNLYLSMADRMGLHDVERFGDSDARLANV
ncbi:MAG: DUF1552 domain-containing protein [Paludisphaera borealis]|uniref:DUF1552 domain-containing protein n=1 Tax=Paludisphaera borealis TaxID=1387353 RepID=UPI00284D5DCF|nr:DUF1552 domain-containing protein [Paludisphaera borealis]MDR3618333.1 DUF1552 domain-containing protein [Paludisphaera borealis]